MFRKVANIGIGYELSVLKKTVAHHWGQLNKERISNCIENVSKDMILAEIRKKLLEEPTLSRWIVSEKELDILALKLYKKMLPIFAFSDISWNISAVSTICWTLAMEYGTITTQKQVQQHEFVVYSDFSELDEDALRYELRVLPDHPKKNEVVTKAILMHAKKRRPLGKEYKISCGYSPSYIIPGFENWRAALVFAKYSHIKI